MAVVTRVITLRITYNNETENGEEFKDMDWHDMLSGILADCVVLEDSDTEGLPTEEERDAYEKWNRVGGAP